MQAVEVSRQDGSITLMQVPEGADDQYIEDRIKELRELHVETERKRIEMLDEWGESALPKFQDFTGWRRVSPEEAVTISRKMKGIK